MGSPGQTFVVRLPTVRMAFFSGLVAYPSKECWGKDTASIHLGTNLGEGSWGGVSAFSILSVVCIYL